jgi:hypothetical protein
MTLIIDRVRMSAKGGVIVKRIVVWAGLVVTVLVGACGDDDADHVLQPGPVTSFEDIVGTYQRQGPGGILYLQFFEDGTLHSSVNRDLIQDRPQGIQETRFEGTKVFVKEIKGACGDDPDAIYEIQLLENGNLKWVAIEEPCGTRSGVLDAEFAPIP